MIQDGRIPFILLLADVQVFSALSMMVPSIYAYHAAPELASNAIFPEGADA